MEVAEPPHAVRVKYAGFTRGKRQLLLPRSRASNRPHRGRGCRTDKRNSASLKIDVAVSLTASLGNVPTTWSVAQTGDYNSDGRSDILWLDSSGNAALWFMNGGTIVSTAALGNFGTSWTVQSLNAE